MDRVRSARLQLGAVKDRLASTFLRPATVKVMERLVLGDSDDPASPGGSQTVTP